MGIANFQGRQSLGNLVNRLIAACQVDIGLEQIAIARLMQLMQKPGAWRVLQNNGSNFFRGPGGHLGRNQGPHGVAHQDDRVMG